MSQNQNHMPTHEESRQRRYQMAYESIQLDKTLQQVAERYGVTREYVRQCRVAVFTPELLDIVAEQKSAYRKRVSAEKREARKAEVKYTKTCIVCGAEFKTNFEPAKSCQGHGPYWRVLRLHIGEHRDQHRRWVAEGVLANRDKFDDIQVRYAERLVNGAETNYHGRWLIHGSIAFKYATEACKNNWPIFKLLPQEIQAQISTAVETVRALESS